MISNLITLALCGLCLHLIIKYLPKAGIFLQGVALAVTLILLLCTVLKILGVIK